MNKKRPIKLSPDSPAAKQTTEGRRRAGQRKLDNGGGTGSAGDIDAEIDSVIKRVKEHIAARQFPPRRLIGAEDSRCYRDAVRQFVEGHPPRKGSEKGVESLSPADVPVCATTLLDLLEALRCRVDDGGRREWEARRLRVLDLLGEAADLLASGQPESDRRGSMPPSVSFDARSAIADLRRLESAVRSRAVAAIFPACRSLSGFQLDLRDQGGARDNDEGAVRAAVVREIADCVPEIKVRKGQRGRSAIVAGLAKLVGVDVGSDYVSALLTKVERSKGSSF